MSETSVFGARKSHLRCGTRFRGFGIEGVGFRVSPGSADSFFLLVYCGCDLEWFVGKKLLCCGLLGKNYSVGFRVIAHAEDSLLEISGCDSRLNDCQLVS